MALAAVLVMVLAVVPTVSAADATTSACTKSYMIQLGLSKSGIDEKAVQVVYGYSPLPESAPGEPERQDIGCRRNNTVGVQPPRSP